MSELIVTTSTQVMHAGAAVSNELRQELAATVDGVVHRERFRHRVTVIGVVLASLVSPLVEYGFGLPVGVTLYLAVTLVLTGSLVWGTVNRALLDHTAAQAGIERTTLIKAMKLRRKGHGPSTALRESLR